MVEKKEKEMEMEKKKEKEKEKDALTAKGKTGSYLALRRGDLQDKKRMKVAHDEASRTEVEGPSLSKYREKMDQMLLPIFRKKQKLDTY